MAGRTTMTQTLRGKTFQDFILEAKPKITEITPDELRQWLAQNKPMTIVDVREESEVAKGTIEGAVPISRGVFELKLHDTVRDQDKPLVLYCGGGNRSALAADVAQQMGYTDVYSLAGGWKGWVTP